MRKFTRLILTTLVFVLITGCAASVKRNASQAPLSQIPAGAASKLVLNVTGTPESLAASDWEGFKQEWRENFAERAALAGVAFEMQDGPARPTGQPGTLLTVNVTDYRFLRPGTRYLVGIMSGNAFIESTLTFNDLMTGMSYGSQTVNTSSSAWEGVFSAMTNKQVEAIAKESLEQIKGGAVVK